jgi:pyruvate,water dikinase
MMIVPLREGTVEAEVGGKAANLSRLMAVAAPVPDGFVLAGKALQHFVAEQEELPREVDHAVMTAWRRLLPGPVIVRSSAIGEDSAEASFAGQLDSVAGVATEEELRAAILKVWASQWSDRVLGYQSARGTLLAGMAIVVQRQVDAVVSGVLFTRSPVAASRMLLEYCPGLGEALVSGAMNPGRIEIDRATLAPAELASLEVPDERAAAVVGQRLRELAALALRVEQAFGAPQDVEWTIDSAGRCWIVQSRPITTPSPDTRGGAGGAAQTVLWSNANVNENFPQPISPLLYSIARQGYYHYFRNLGTAFGVSEHRLRRMEPALRQIIGVHGARMYYNLTSIHHVLESAPFGDRLAASFDDFVGAESDETRSASSKASRAYEVAELAVIAANTAWQFSFLTRRVSEFERSVERFAADTHPSRLETKSTHDLLDDLRAFMDIRCHRWKNASLADAGSMVCYGLLKQMLARAFPADDQQALHNTLLKALPDLVSSMPPLALWELSRMIRANPPLHQLVRSAPAAEVLTRIRTDERFADFAGALDDFLEKWGFRCPAELMLTVPSFQEDPAPVIDLLRAYAATDGESPAGQLARQSAERAHETRRVLRALRGRRLTTWLPLPLSTPVRIVLRWTQRSIQLRERARLKQALLYSRLRRVALALGERLARAGRLEGGGDIFFLAVDEIDLLVSGGEMFPGAVSHLVSLRREAHDRLSASSPPDSLRLAPGEYFAAAVAAAPGPADDSHSKLHGVGACGGSRTATAAILADVTESHRLEAGNILVTRQTDPGWGPIFPLISGLVIERGGMLSHGAIIAREFGIPSVVGVKDATRLIQHGGCITVDGDRGLVHLGVGATA